MTTLVYRGEPVMIEALVWIARHPCGCTYAACVARTDDVDLLTADEARDWFKKNRNRLAPDTTIELATLVQVPRLFQDQGCKANHR